jgi:hypothetical protein
MQWQAMTAHYLLVETESRTEEIAAQYSKEWRDTGI